MDLDFWFCYCCLICLAGLCLPVENLIPLHSTLLMIKSSPSCLVNCFLLVVGFLLMTYISDLLLFGSLSLLHDYSSSGSYVSVCFHEGANWPFVSSVSVSILLASSHNDEFCDFA